MKIGVVITAVMILAGAYWIWAATNTPNSYEECMLAEMRGQEENMYAMEQATCERRFQKETRVTVNGGDWVWINESGLQQVSFSGEVANEFRIRRGVFSFSDKGC